MSCRKYFRKIHSYKTTGTLNDVKKQTLSCYVNSQGLYVLRFDLFPNPGQDPGTKLDQTRESVQVLLLFISTDKMALTLCMLLCNWSNVFFELFFFK